VLSKKISAGSTWPVVLEQLDKVFDSSFAIDHGS
jgi:hypothetical protein